MDAGVDFPFAEAIEFLAEYSWLAEFRIVDFLTHDYWNTCCRIPDTWRSFVDEDLASDTDHASVLMDLAGLEATRVPAKIEEYRARAYTCSLVPKRPRESGTAATERRKNVKLKKTYEIERLSDQILQLTRDNGLNLAVDIGAGQGYLALELLSRDDQLTVVAVESADGQVHGVAERLKAFPIDAQSRLSLKQVHLVADRPGQFEDLIFTDRAVQEYLLYSLHACGSLSECMVQTFCHPENKATCLFNIACCYNLIDETLPGAHFPLSRKVASAWSGSGLQLTRNVKMVACQAPFRWKHRPQQTRNFLKRHFYRALLELLVVEAYPEQAQHHLGKLGTIGDAYLVSFGEYAAAAFSSMGLVGFVPEVAEGLLQRHGHLANAIAFLWTMRALLGPCVEAVILYDRYCHLKETLPLARVSLVPVLDPLRSPRNIALIAEKNKQHK